MNMYRDSSVRELRKQEEKPKMDLMFPRLYINDNAEKKGPKAPPRNKMALYEHLTTHNSNHNSNQSQHLQPNNNTSTMLVPSPFFDHNAYTNERSFIPSLCDSSGSTTTTTHFNLNPTMETPQQHHQKEQRTSNVKTFQLHNCYNNTQISSSAEKKLNKNDDNRVQPNSSSNGQEKTHKTKAVHCSYGEPITTFQQQLKQPTSTKLKLTHHQAQDNTKLFHPGHIQSRGGISELCPNPKKRSLVDYITRYVDPKIHLHQDYSGLKNNSLTEPKSAARKRNELEAIHECNNEVITGFQEREEERNHCVGLDISPDGVLGVMGQKQFLNTRSTLVYQQRVFAVQVFELHRLIKVQRLIAGSPELILDGSFYLQNPSNPTIKTPYGNANEPPPPTIPKLKNDNEILKFSDCAAESVVTKIPLPLRNDAVKFEPNTEPLPSTAMDAKSDNKPSSGPTQLDEANLTPFCLHPPPGNQWLVPVSSPSEGLVYKPYTGACPPAGLMASICGPIPFTPAYATFLSGTPLGPTYFAPYGVPLINPFARPESNGVDNQLCIREVNYTAPHQSSCNMLRHKSGESDLQGSTGSSPTERTRVDPLPLFPIEPAVQSSNEPPKSHSTDLNTLVMNHSTDQKQIQVIKVVPHNAKSACESAARIFRSIQEERRGYD